MLTQVIQDLIKKQRPYYLLQDKEIKGVDNNYWLIFQHRDAANLLQNIVSFLGFQKHSTYKLIRIDLNNAHIFEYTPKKESNIPNPTLLRTSNLTVIEQFLNLENATKEENLIKGTFLELENTLKKRRRFNLPQQLDQYNQFITAYLERTKIYRRSTAYFNSGVLKLYQEPLLHLVLNDGKINLLMDWQGFTNQRDIQELERLHNPEYRQEYITRTLTEFLQGLEDKTFTSTTILAELVRLEILTIKLVKMQETRGIFHKKTGILTDNLDNSILHEGSDNFTAAAHSQNAESVTFLYYSDGIDLDTINQSIREFDLEWNDPHISFDLTQQFLQKILEEKQRRQQEKQPHIDTITPDNLPTGKTTEVEITGKNLEQIETIEIPENPLIDIEITKQESTKIEGKITIDANHPPQPIESLRLKEKQGTYNVKKIKPVTVKPTLTIPEFPEIEGFKQAIELILQGKAGTPEDFLYWLAQQKPYLLKIQSSNILDQLQDQGILFEHQKSGAQHCLRVMQQFGVAVCADAVGLGKTRLAAAVAKLYLEENPQTKIAIIAAKKLHDNWLREMAELGLTNKKHYELYNKNLMSRNGNQFLDDFTRFGGADLVMIDEAHEGIRNYNNRIHKTCLKIKDNDQITQRQRYYLLLTATPWNNRREDIYNILSPFLTRPEGFIELGLPLEVKRWFESREIGIENFTDTTDIFRRTYRELFLQRTRKMLRDATPDLQLYAQRIAQWLPVEFETETEQALEQIFSQFESNLFIPFADPIRYLTENVEQRSLLRNQRRMFLQRAESSMYALRRTIKNFSAKIHYLKQQLEKVTPDADGLKQFLLQHYKFENDNFNSENNWLENEENYEEDYWEDDDDEEEEETRKEEKRQQLRRSIDIATDNLRNNPQDAIKIYNRILADCDSDLQQLHHISILLANEFVTDHKRQQVSQKVAELVQKGHKVLLISTFSDTVIDYYRYMTQNTIIASHGIGMATGGQKIYFTDDQTPIKILPNNTFKGNNQQTGLKRQDLFRKFAPEASCKNPQERPNSQQEIAVLIGSETLSVGQNLQDADYLINIDLPWNPMILEQRIGRIDRPKSHPCPYIYIYYANSESQLLRQASRLDNLNKKLIGDLANNENIPDINNVNDLGASVYGDTLFDDEILPGYIDFIRSLVQARKLEQGSLQEAIYQKQETSRELYSQNEILHREELRKLYERLGVNYQAIPITIGQGNNSPPNNLVALTIAYYDSNYKPIPEQSQVIYWNDLTGIIDGFGRAISTAFKTPQCSNIIPTNQLLEQANLLYQQLIQLKQEYQQELEETETLENIKLNSERLSKIQKRIQNMSTFPSSINRKTVKNILNQLSQGKELKKVQQILRNYSDGNNSKLDDPEFMINLVKDTEQLSLLTFDPAKPASLKISLSAMLLKT